MHDENAAPKLTLSPEQLERRDRALREVASFAARAPLLLAELLLPDEETSSPAPTESPRAASSAVRSAAVGMTQAGA